MIITKRKWNNNGNNTISLLFLVIVIGLLIWQFVIPVYIDYSSFTDTIGLTESEPDIITFSAGLFNTYTNEFRISNKPLIDFDSNPRDEHENLTCYDLTLSGENSILNHQVIIQTNAPKKITNPYRVIIVVEKVTWTHEVIQDTIYQKSITSGDGLKTYKRQLLTEEILLSGALLEYSVITCRLLDYTGDILHTERWAVR